jgi:predicted Rossmann fold nucleotide-binding protein DprA/Smf involved in DNA uptake
VRSTTDDGNAFVPRLYASTTIADLERRGIRWVARRERGFPSRLRVIHDPPPGLFVRGTGGLELLDSQCVAVVGARACSAYGSAVAMELGRGLARAGVIVVSGLARGVDAAAHRGALETGTTVAVLGCGIDRDYPRTHRMLAASIAERGLIVSEYPPAVEPAVPQARRHRAAEMATRGAGDRGPAADPAPRRLRLRGATELAAPHRHGGIVAASGGCVDIENPGRGLRAGLRHPAGPM